MTSFFKYIYNKFHFITTSTKTCTLTKLFPQRSTSDSSQFDHNESQQGAFLQFISAFTLICQLSDDPEIQSKTKSILRSQQPKFVFSPHKHARWREVD